VLQLRTDALRELAAVKEALATEKRKREEDDAGLRQQLEKQFQEQARPNASLFLFIFSYIIFFIRSCGVLLPLDFLICFRAGSRAV
jgi:hypothetical protein